MSEKEVAYISFPTINGRFDYLGFTSKDEGAHHWCNDVFLFYWEEARLKEYFTELPVSRLPPLLVHDPISTGS